MEEFQTNDQIGGVYRVVRSLGKGGMGAVYEVVHEKLGVRYALKTFTLDHGHVRLLKERFLAEGRILARLHHPNLVRVFDLDVDAATQTPYFVMDLVLYKDGEPYTLADVEDGSADEEHLARWFGQLCSALDYIHDAGIVHRDIKLNNILLDARGGVVLSDFGVSRFCGRQLRQELAIDRTILADGMTTGNLIMGTVGYMAPEVRRGEDATAASDAYSLGIVFFRLLTGVWFENRPNIWGLLEPFGEEWKGILRWLLAENPNGRPIRLASLGQRLQPSAAQSAVTVPGRSRRRLAAILLGAAVLAVILTGVALAMRRSGSDDSVRTDDLFAIPAISREN